MGIFNRKNSSVPDAYQALANRQQYLLQRKAEYEKQLRMLRNRLDQAIDAENEKMEAMLRKKIENMKERMAELDEEYDRNSKNITSYSTDIKNHTERGALIASTLVSAIGTGGFLWLSNSAKNMSWSSDVNGEPMQNKQTKDMLKMFLSCLNPTRWFHH
ncbi:hypothetical protein [Pseudobutyrivibrio sp.]